MLLVDMMRLAREMPRAKPELPWYHSQAFGLFQTDRVLREFDLHAFTGPALEVAADLRVDTAERLERIAESVFSRPRKVFIEASGPERLSRLSRIRGFPRNNSLVTRTQPQRVGLAIDVVEPGRALIDVMWCFQRKQLLDSIKAVQLLAGARTRLEKDATEARFRLGFGHMRIAVDLKGAPGLDRKAFDALPPGDPLLSDMRNLTERLLGEGARESTIRANLWRLYRLNQICSMEMIEEAQLSMSEELLVGRTPEEVVANAQRDLDGEIIYAIALLAALDAGEQAVSISWRAPRAERQKANGQKKVSQSDLAIDRLGTVSLNISDRSILRALEAGVAERAETGGALPRVRHPVRGHLFRARNGMIVYRRPHWRGGRQAEQVVRMVR